MKNTKNSEDPQKLLQRGRAPESAEIVTCEILPNTGRTLQRGRAPESAEIWKCSFAWSS